MPRGQQNYGKANRSKPGRAKSGLRLPDLEHSKAVVPNSLPVPSIESHCSEPRLAFNRTVVLRYRIFLEQKNLAPSRINVRLGEVRRLADEAADNGPAAPNSRSVSAE